MPIKKQITMTELSVLRIDYVRGTDTIPVEFEITDYAIPSGAKAFFYVTKAGDKEKKRLSGTISGQKVTFTPEESTFDGPGQYCATLIIEQADGKSFGSFPIFIESAPNAAEEG